MADTRDQQSLQDISARIRQGDNAGARAKCEAFFDLIGDATRQAPVRIQLGMIEQRSGHLSAALAQYEIARQSDRRNPHLILQLGLTHFQLGHLEQAEPLYREAIRLEPRLAIAHYNLGVLLQQKREFPAARRAFEAALVHQPRFPEALNNLGNVLIEVQDLTGASSCFRQAIALQPAFSYAHHGLGLLMMRQMRRVEALPCLLAAVKHDPAFLDAWLDLAECQAQMGDVDAAKVSIAAVLAQEPSHTVARFRRAIYTGEQPDSTPPEWVERLYAGMAASFDTHLVDRLGYQIPSRMEKALKPWLDQFATAHLKKPLVIDLGCGTGLFGLQIRASAARLIGVDLSPAMLEAARARNVYDELVLGELEAFLDSLEDAADLIAATDVLIYVGNLARLFSKVFAQLIAGGVFAFSTETPDDLAEGIRLQPSGRYAHSCKYIEQLAEANGFCVRVREAAVIRTESAVAVNGFIFILEKNAGAS